MALRTNAVLVTIVATVVTIGGIACTAPAPRQEVAPPPPDYAAQLRPIVDIFIGVWNSKEYDKLDGILSADFHRTAPDQNAEGPAAMKAFMAQVHTAYPDFHIVVDESAYKDGVAFVQWTVTGTNTGEGANPPTGKSVNISGITLLRFADGKITEEIVQFDTATLMAQLEASAVPHASQ